MQEKTVYHPDTYLQESELGYGNVQVAAHLSLLGVPATLLKKTEIL